MLGQSSKYISSEVSDDDLADLFFRRRNLRPRWYNKVSIRGRAHMKNRHNSVLRSILRGIALSCDISGNAMIRQSSALLAPGGPLRDARNLAKDGQRCFAKILRKG
jgi:hypothetical protein